MIFVVMEVIAAIWEASACPPVKVRTSPGSSAGSPMVSESNGTYRMTEIAFRILLRMRLLVSSSPNCKRGFVSRFMVRPSSGSRE